MSLRNSASASADVDSIDLIDVVRAIGRGWRALVICTLIGAVVAIGVIRYAPRTFAGVTTAVIKGQSGSALTSAASALAGGGSGTGDASGGGGAGAVLGALGGKSQLETEVVILTSANLVGRAVDSLNLQARAVEPRGAVASLLVSAVSLPGSFKHQRFHFTRPGHAGEFTVSWADSNRVTKNGVAALPVGTVTLTHNPPLDDFVLDLMDHEDAIKRVIKHLTIAKPGGEVVTIDYRGDDSLVAPAVANAMLKFYMDWRHVTDRGVNTERVDFLEREVDSVSRALRLADDARRKQAEASGLSDPITIARLDLESESALSERVRDLSLENGALQRLIAMVQGGTLDTTQLSASPVFMKSPAFASLISEITNAQQARAMALVQRTESDPAVANYSRMIKDDEARLLTVANQYASSVAAELTVVRNSLDSSRAVVQGLPAESQASTEAERNVATLTRLNAVMIGQLVDAELAAIGEGGEVHLLDPATPEKKPRFPNKALTLGAGVGSGLLLGILLAVFGMSHGRWLGDPRAIERVVGVPTHRLAPGTPLLMTGQSNQTVLVAPLDAGTRTRSVVERLLQTAQAGSVSAAELDLTNGHHGDAALDVNSTIERLQREHGLVVVSLPSIASDAAAATMRPGRPVLIVSEGRRVDRERLTGMVELLRRLDVPCAGIVLTDRRSKGQDT